MKEAAKLVVLSKFLAESLTISMPNSESAMSINDLKDITDEAKLEKKHMVLETVLYVRMFSAFWNEEYGEAMDYSQQILALPSSKLFIKIHTVYHILFRGIIAFEKYRDGEGEMWLDTGNVCLSKYQTFVESLSYANFQSKLLILQAEQLACESNIVASQA